MNKERTSSVNGIADVTRTEELTSICADDAEYVPTRALMGPQTSHN